MGHSTANFTNLQLLHCFDKISEFLVFFWWGYVGCHFPCFPCAVGTLPFLLCRKLIELITIETSDIILIKVLPRRLSMHPGPAQSVLITYGRHYRLPAGVGRHPPPPLSLQTHTPAPSSQFALSVVNIIMRNGRSRARLWQQ